MLQATPGLAVEGGGDSLIHADGDDMDKIGGAADEGKEIGAGTGRDIPSRKPARARQKALKRCSVM